MYIYGVIDWKLQLLWYPLLQEKTLKVPQTIFKLTGSLDGLFSCDDELIKANPDWLDLFEACKRSPLLTDKLFERASQWTYQLLLLWTCPEKDNIIVSGFTRVLHPFYSPSCSLEYTNLIVHFLDRLYDSTDFHDIINQNASTDYSVFIQRLSAKGTKSYFKVCYIARLLEENNQLSDLQPNQEAYYISNMIGILQGLLQWGDIGKRGQTRSYSELKERITYGSEPLVDLYYPLLVDAEMRSDRALSILTLAHLLEWKPARSELREIVNRLVMQIVEGLVDPESGQQFERMVSQQPKSRYVAFKKRSRQTPELCKEITRRPVLMSDERDLLESRLVAKELSQVLNTNNDTSDKRLYFICRKID
ncbi:MAG: hypothetical protein EXX96DRAFT_548236 [Benjaminiella poitrasii]|nr:MAG: hypothetical protein EXX96DRAFT_548236 [Benjaminiella poitrasii]